MKHVETYLEDFLVQDHEGFEGDHELDQTPHNYHPKPNHHHFHRHHRKYQEVQENIANTQHSENEPDQNINENDISERENAATTSAAEVAEVAEDSQTQDLPEANPLMTQTKPEDFKPRILIHDYKYAELPNILSNNIETEYRERFKLKNDSVIKEDEQLFSTNEDWSIQKQQVKKITTSLYEKYEQQKNYLNVYSRYRQKKSTEEKARNFAGSYINLSCVVDFGSTMFYTFHMHRLNRKEFGLEFDLYNRIETKKIEDHSRKQNSIQFDSRFECGNLFSVYTKQVNREYDLILQNDINTKGYAQWFFFKVHNFKFKDLQVCFNIVNLSKGGTLYNQGMKPVVFSIKEHEQNNSGWIRKGQNVSFKKNYIVKEQDPNQYYDTLSFTYTFEYENDEVYFAMNVPYSYSKMISHLEQAMEEVHQRYPNIISNNPVPILSITERCQEIGQSDKEQLRNKNKRVVWIIARQHPGESVSSYKMEGVIDYLLSDSFEAVYLRKKFIFKLIPMMNPDGVIYGNFRCNLAGADINRQWISPSRVLHPSVYYAKKAINQNRDAGQRIEYFIDLHGHSKKLNSFIYACRKEDDLISCRLFPVIYSQVSNTFQFKDCTFELEEYKARAARIVIWNEFNQIKEQGFCCNNIFTVETSLFGYRGNKRIHHFMIKDLHSIGEDLIRSMYINHKEVDKDLYPSINKQNIISKMNEDIQQFIVKNQKDSGSDSDPLADELDMDEQFEKVIPVKIAKRLGIEINRRGSLIFKSRNRKIIQASSPISRPQTQNGSPLILQHSQVNPNVNTHSPSPATPTQGAQGNNVHRSLSKSGISDQSLHSSTSLINTSQSDRSQFLVTDSQTLKGQMKKKSKFHRNATDSIRNNVSNQCLSSSDKDIPQPQQVSSTALQINGISNNPQITGLNNIVRHYTKKLANPDSKTIHNTSIIIITSQDLAFKKQDHERRKEPVLGSSSNYYPSQNSAQTTSNPAQLNFQNVVLNQKSDKDKPLANSNDLTSSRQSLSKSGGRFSVLVQDGSLCPNPVSIRGLGSESNIKQRVSLISQQTSSNLSTVQLSDVKASGNLQRIQTILPPATGKGNGTNNCDLSIQGFPVCNPLKNTNAPEPQIQASCHSNTSHQIPILSSPSTLTESSNQPSLVNITSSSSQSKISSKVGQQPQNYFLTKDSSTKQTQQDKGIAVYPCNSFFTGSNYQQKQQNSQSYLEQLQTSPSNQQQMPYLNQLNSSLNSLASNSSALFIDQNKPKLSQVSSSPSFQIRPKLFSGYSGNRGKGIYGVGSGDDKSGLNNRTRNSQQNHNTIELELYLKNRPQTFSKEKSPNQRFAEPNLLASGGYQSLIQKVPFIVLGKVPSNSDEQKSLRFKYQKALDDSYTKSAAVSSNTVIEERKQTKKHFINQFNDKHFVGSSIHVQNKIQTKPWSTNTISFVDSDNKSEYGISSSSFAQKINDNRNIYNNSDIRTSFHNSDNRNILNNNESPRTSMNFQNKIDDIFFKNKEKLYQSEIGPSSSKDLNNSNYNQQTNIYYLSHKPPK